MKRKPKPAPRAVVTNAPTQQALNRAYAFMDEMQPVIEARRAERERRQGEAA